MASRVRPPGRDPAKRPERSRLLLSWRDQSTALGLVVGRSTLIHTYERGVSWRTLGDAITGKKVWPIREMHGGSACHVGCPHDFRFGPRLGTTIRIRPFPKYANRLFQAAELFPRPRQPRLRGR